MNIDTLLLVVIAVCVVLIVLRMPHAPSKWRAPMKQAVKRQLADLGGGKAELTFNNGVSIRLTVLDVDDVWVHCKLEKPKRTQNIGFSGIDKESKIIEEIYRISTIANVRSIKE